MSIGYFKYSCKHLIFLFLLRINWSLNWQPELLEFHWYSIIRRKKQNSNSSRNRVKSWNEYKWSFDTRMKFRLLKYYTLTALLREVYTIYNAGVVFRLSDWFSCLRVNPIPLDFRLWFRHWQHRLRDRHCILNRLGIGISVQQFICHRSSRCGRCDFTRTRFIWYVVVYQRYRSLQRWGWIVRHDDTETKLSSDSDSNSNSFRFLF